MSVPTSLTPRERPLCPGLVLRPQARRTVAVGREKRVFTQKTWHRDICLGATVARRTVDGFAGERFWVVGPFLPHFPPGTAARRPGRP